MPGEGAELQRAPTGTEAYEFVYGIWMAAKDKAGAEPMRADVQWLTQRWLQEGMHCRVHFPCAPTLSPALCVVCASHTRVLCYLYYPKAY